MRQRDESVASVPWDRLFLIIGSLLGIGFVLLTPALDGVDEFSHFVRVSLIADGWIIAPKSADDAPAPSDYVVNGCDAGYVSGQVRTLMKANESEIPLDWSEQFRNSECGSPDSSLTDSVAAQNVYTPIPYAPALAGYAVGHAIDGPVGSLYGARLAQLAAFLALGWFAIRIIPWGKPLLFTICLFPVALQTASTISEDPITLGLAVLLIALVLSACDQARRGVRLSTKEVVALGVVAAALTVAKSVYAPFVLLVLVIPTVAFGSRRRQFRTNTVIIAVAVVLGAAWAIGVVTGVRVALLNGADSIRGAEWIRHHPLDFPVAVVRAWTDPAELSTVVQGVFVPVYRSRPNPTIPIVALCLWLVFARLADPVPKFMRRGVRLRRDPADLVLAGADRRRSVLVAVSVAVASFLLIEYGIAITVNPPGATMIEMMQGRYLLPLIPLTLFGFGGVRVWSPPRVWLLVLPAVTVVVGIWWLWHVEQGAFGWF